MKPTQPTTRHSRRGRTGWERHDVEADADEVGPRLQAATDRAACAAAPHQHQPPPPATRHSPQRATPWQEEGGQRRRRTAAPRHAAGGGPRPGPAPTDARPADVAPHATPPANNNRTWERRMSCRQQPAPPPRDAAKMSPRISIGPEPVLAAHVFVCLCNPSRHRPGFNKARGSGGEMMMMSDSPDSTKFPSPSQCQPEPAE
jgi:hypothetical protein